MSFPAANQRGQTRANNLTVPAMTPNVTANSAAGSMPGPPSTSAVSRVDRGLGGRRWPIERSLAWLLENKRLALRYDRLGYVVQSLLESACIFLATRRLGRQL